jgi:Co/Zn/Cd efflux system component
MHFMPIVAASNDSQAMIVALALFGLVAVIMVAAILRYPANDVVKIWSLLGALTGLITGAVGSYFFTRPQIEQANAQVQQASDASKQIVELSEQVGLPKLAELSPEETRTVLNAANLPHAATQPAEWKANVVRLHTLTARLGSMGTNR